ncbi:MAG: DUF99 family protein [Candidatus Hadarchaeales archaeon]
MKPVKFWDIKPEIRVVGIDDGPFEPHARGTVLLVGAVFRGGYWLEGVLHAHVQKDGFDATQRIIEMINKSRHKGQLRVVMMEGVTVAGFKEVFKRTGLPVIVASRKRPNMAQVKKALKNLPEWQRRWEMLRSAGKLYQVKLRRGTKPLYMQFAGISRSDAERVIRLTCTHALMPEPLRVAHLIATGVGPQRCEDVE